MAKGRGCPGAALGRRIAGVGATLPWVGYLPIGQGRNCTPGHPFFVEGRGWVLAGDLRAGDELEARGERVVVAAIEVRAERAETFNFEVACHHTYRVSSGAGQPGVLVHNRSAAAKLLRPTRFHVRTVKQTDAMRKAFERAGGPRERFLRNLGRESDEALKAQGLSARTIKSIRQGEVPAGFNVHHKIPIFRGGSNSSRNLILMREAYHEKHTKLLHWYDGPNPLAGVTAKVFRSP